MKKEILTLTLLASAALGGCDNKDHTIVAGTPNDNQPAVAKIDPSLLPPAIVASTIYRCKDNSVVYIDWLADNLSANFRAKQNDTPKVLKAPEAGKPLTTADGYSLTGSATGATVTLTRPGMGAQSCKA